MFKNQKIFEGNQKYLIIFYYETYLICRYVKISLGNLKIVIKNDPQATEPK